MKLSIITLSLLGTAFLQEALAGWKALRGRDLVEENNNGMLVSGHEPDDGDAWCITATNGVGLYALLGFRKCDFDQVPYDQLFEYRGNKFVSASNPDRCFEVHSLTEDPLVLLANCKDDAALQKFDFNPNDPTSKIKVQADNSFCITNNGLTPDPGDTIKAVKCSNNDRFLYSFQREDEMRDYTGTYSLISDEADDGCLVVKDEKPFSGQSLTLDCCKMNHKWRYDSSGRLHTALDDRYCMHAGPQRGTPKENTRIRLYRCDENKERQEFDWNWDAIKLRNSDNLCVGFQGTTGKIGDNLILKKCHKKGNNWSED